MSSDKGRNNNFKFLISKASDRVKHFNNKINDTNEIIGEKVSKNLDKTYKTVLAAPIVTLAFMLLISSWFAYSAKDFGDQIEGDVEIYLPEGAESTDLLLQVREQWSTDIALVYVQTNNALYGDENANITNQNILREISWVEGDSENIGESSTKRGLDYKKDDRGKEDGVVWVLSISQIIKEANSSDGRFINSFCEHGLEERIPLSVPCSQTDQVTWGSYSIPDQERIDEIVSRLQGSLSDMVADTNNDGVWDTTFILIGLRHDLSESEHNDFSGIHMHIQNILDNRSSVGLIQTEMTLTGLTKVLEDISEEVYYDLTKIMPWSLIFVVGIVTLLHRSWKIVLISGIPIVMALAVTLGSTVVFDVMLTPMIISAGPILVGLGVDYALHIVNRIEESKRRILDEIQERNYHARQKGRREEILPDEWDSDLFREAVMESMTTTGKAVLLSAVTTMIGFGVLTVSKIVPIIPMRTVGITLVLGILCTLIFSGILVPVLAWLLKFTKRKNPTSWKNIGRAPVKYFALIILVTAMFSGWGLIYMKEELGKPIAGSSEAPEGIKSLETLAEYSVEFEAGQTSMFIFTAEDRDMYNGTSKIRDLPVLDTINVVETEVSKVQNTTTTSLITFLKSIHITLGIDGNNAYNDSLWGMLHNKCWEWDGDSNIEIEDLPLCTTLYGMEQLDSGSRAELRGDLVDVSLDTLSEEVRSMLMNEEESKTLIYVEQPYMNLIKAGGLRDEIDLILSKDSDLLNTNTSKLTGGLPVSLDINKGIHNTQSLTTIVTLFVLTGFLVLIFRNFRIGVTTMIPVAIVILWQPLLMRGGDVNVNVFTAMVGSIVFGIGVDDCIHMIERIREEGETPNGIVNSIESTGQTIFETSVTTMAGIAAGFLVEFPGLENFFMLMFLLIGFAFITSVFLLPAIITAWYELKSRISGNGTWIRFEGDTIFESSENTIKDAVLIND
ncbi:MAG: hypothetical protein CMB56_002740 [Methanobacteriota archaeon]|nr:MAG: hypothetical protein CMB56_002740 [Euryarchaeota archaeon]